MIRWGLHAQILVNHVDWIMVVLDFAAVVLLLLVVVARVLKV